MLVEVAFKGNRKEFFNWSRDDQTLPLKAAVIVEADRGEDLGYVHSVGELAEKRIKGVAHAPDPEEGVTQNVRRLASPEEVRQANLLRSQDEEARRAAMERVKANGLVMKLSDAEWRWDRRKLTIYFTAEKRVDFRNLVRELASTFRTRIELKQIGVRDEAKRLSGIGRCGREYCSASWLPELRPVNLGVARDQKLSLNPTQISGACGRLMCCLRYEHDFYVQQRKRFPKEGRVITTSLGSEKVISNDIFRERVTLRNAEGETRVVSLMELKPEWKQDAGGRGDALLDEETPPLPFEALSDEVLRLQDTSELPAWMPRSESGGAAAARRPAPSGRSLPVRDATSPASPPRTQERTAGETDQASGTEGRRPPRSQQEASKGRDEQPGADSKDAKKVRRRRGRRGGKRNRGNNPGSAPDGGAAPESHGGEPE